MWNSYAKLPRLKKALQSREIDPEKMSIAQLLHTLEKRGMTDHTMNNIVWTLISHLEPPGCRMSHCEHYGNSGAPCNCSLERIPGRCKDYREYLKRREERAAKIRPVNDEEYSSYLSLLRSTKGMYKYPTEEEITAMAIPREKLAVIGPGTSLCEFGEMPDEAEEKKGVANAD
jgi:hypothetical protein